MLPDGKVLVAAGFGEANPRASAELYDPASGSWTRTAIFFLARFDHTTTLLPDGHVLLAGGTEDYENAFVSAQLYDVGLGFSDAWRPAITRATSMLKSDQSLRLAGSHFQGVSQASGGNAQDSSTNYPVVQLRSIDNNQVAFLTVDPVEGWSDTNFTSLPVQDFAAGPALVTVFTNGIPSKAKYLVVAEP